MRRPLNRHRAATAVLTTATALSLALSAAPASAATGIGDPYYPDDGNPGYDVTHYDVRIAYDPARTDHLDGDTTVTARATQALDSFTLDLKGFKVGSVTVDGTPAKSFSRSGAHKLAVVPAQRVADGATFAVRVKYAGKPDGEGWHTLEDGGANVANEPHSATSWYPANDHPSDKATFSLTATVPKGWTAVGNGKPGPTTTKDGSTTFRWHEDKPMVTYAGTVAIDKFTVRSTKLPDGKPLILASSPGVPMGPETEAEQTEVLEFLASKFGPYPFSSAGGIGVGASVDGVGPGAMETQSRPTYSAAITDIAASHEVAHQWFGNSVSMADWRSSCLSECFATYATQLWFEHQGDQLDKGYYAGSIDDHKNDPKFWSMRLYDPGAGKELDADLYEKGALMLHALRRTVGDDAFFGTLKRWTHDHAYGNVTFPQFEALAAKVSGKDLKGFFDAWAHGTKIPPKQYLYPGSLGALDHA